MNAIFEKMTYRELTLELLLIGILTIGEVINKRIIWRENILKQLIYN